MACSLPGLGNCSDWQLVSTVETEWGMRIPIFMAIHAAGSSTSSADARPTKIRGAQHSSGPLQDVPRVHERTEARSSEGQADVQLHSSAASRTANLPSEPAAEASGSQKSDKLAAGSFDLDSILVLARDRSNSTARSNHLPGTFTFHDDSPVPSPDPIVQPISRCCTFPGISDRQIL